MPLGLKSFDKECFRGSFDVTCSDGKQWLDNSLRDTGRISTAVSAFDTIISHGQNLCKIWLQIERKNLFCGDHSTEIG